MFDDEAVAFAGLADRFTKLAPHKRRTFLRNYLLKSHKLKSNLLLSPSLSLSQSTTSSFYSISISMSSTNPTYTSHTTDLSSLMDLQHLDHPSTNPKYSPRPIKNSHNDLALQYILQVISLSENQTLEPHLINPNVDPPTTSGMMRLLPLLTKSNVPPPSSEGFHAQQQSQNLLRIPSQPSKRESRIQEKRIRKSAMKSLSSKQNPHQTAGAGTRKEKKTVRFADLPPRLRARDVPLIPTTSFPKHNSSRDSSSGVVVPGLRSTSTSPSPSSLVIRLREVQEPTRAPTQGQGQGQGQGQIQARAVLPAGNNLAMVGQEGYEDESSMMDLD